MMLKKILLVIFLTLAIKPVYAYDFNRPNNKFGIHLAQPHLPDLKAVADLVNSTGGDWGYVTLVIQENDRNLSKWQEIFDRLREYNLIPIIRIATQPEGENWRRPKEDEAGDWANFLNSLNWVVKNRYIILFNEPNHGAEWGGGVDEESYAKVVLAFAKKLKETNGDFFIMLAGLDASAPQSPPGFEDEEVFLKQILNFLPPEAGFNFIDGWSSHSYPNPAFSGSPYDSGKGTVRTYQWELNILQSLGIKKNLPVFITETGWSRKISNLKFQISNENTIAEYYKTAFENVWLPDNSVVAVTPFVFDYQSEPFLEFSWKHYQNDGFYQQYYTVQAMTKTKGEPEQIDTGQMSFNLPRELVANSNYHFIIHLKNQGQAVWDKNENYELRIQNSELQSLEYFFSDLKKNKPFQESDIDLYLKTGNNVGENNLKITLLHNNKNILPVGEWPLQILPLPSLKFKIQAFPKLETTGSDFEIQIFDDRQGLIFKRDGLRVTKGDGTLEDIQNIVLGKKYRVVILRPYYLPRQEFTTFKKDNNLVKFKRMFPIDFNADGKFDFTDLITLLKNLRLTNLLLP